MATASLLSWNHSGDASNMVKPVERIGQFSPEIGYSGFMQLALFMVIFIPRARGVSIPRITGNPISQSATTCMIAVAWLLP